jgi:hypothetical protein
MSGPPGKSQGGDIYDKSLSGTCATSAVQSATCRVQRASCSVRRATCDVRRAACGVRPCYVRRRRLLVFHRSGASEDRRYLRSPLTQSSAASICSWRSLYSASLTSPSARASSKWLDSSPRDPRAITTNRANSGWAYRQNPSATLLQAEFAADRTCSRSFGYWPQPRRLTMGEISRRRASQCCQASRSRWWRMGMAAIEARSVPGPLPSGAPLGVRSSCQRPALRIR